MAVFGFILMCCRVHPLPGAGSVQKGCRVHPLPGAAFGVLSGADPVQGAGCVFCRVQRLGCYRVLILSRVPGAAFGVLSGADPVQGAGCIFCRVHPLPGAGSVQKGCRVHLLPGASSAGCIFCRVYPLPGAGSDRLRRCAICI